MKNHRIISIILILAVFAGAALFLPRKSEAALCLNVPGYALPTRSQATEQRPAGCGASEKPNSLFTGKNPNVVFTGSLEKSVEIERLLKEIERLQKIILVLKAAKKI